MNWYEEGELTIHNENNYAPDNIIRITNDDYPEKKYLSIVPQFFMTPTALHQRNTLVSIPTPNAELYQYVISNIAVHFSKVLVANFKGNPIEVSMQYLKESSQKMFLRKFEDNNLHPIIQECYGTWAMKESKSAPANMYTLRIKNESIRCSPDEQFDTVWNFINDTYIQDRGLFSISVNWKFGDELRHSLFLSYLCQYNLDIYLDVNRESNRVNMIHVKEGIRG